MSRIVQFRLLAAYNEWMNQKVYEGAGRLDPDSLRRDRGAFFGSILGTLSHLVNADTIWLLRFGQLPRPIPILDEVRQWPAPDALDSRLFDDFDALRAHRRVVDGLIRRWIEELQEEDLDQDLHYRSMRGVPAQRPFALLLLHFFNHQTHHRGQVSTLLTQAGIDLGVTDLVAMSPEPT